MESSERARGWLSALALDGKRFTIRIFFSLHFTLLEAIRGRKLSLWFQFLPSSQWLKGRKVERESFLYRNIRWCSALGITNGNSHIQLKAGWWWKEWKITSSSTLVFIQRRKGMVESTIKNFIIHSRLLLRQAVLTTKVRKARNGGNGDARWALRKCENLLPFSSAEGKSSIDKTKDENHSIERTMKILWNPFALNFN